MPVLWTVWVGVSGLAVLSTGESFGRVSSVMMTLVRCSPEFTRPAARNTAAAVQLLPSPP
jgi:hypothetical protein